MSRTQQGIYHLWFKISLWKKNPHTSYNLHVCSHFLMIVHYLSQTFILLDYSVPSELDHWSPWPHWKWFKVRCADPCPDSRTVSGISTTVPSDVGVLPAAVLGRDSGHWETPLCPPGRLHWTHLQGKHTPYLSALWFYHVLVFLFFTDWFECSLVNQPLDIVILYKWILLLSIAMLNS